MAAIDDWFTSGRAARIANRDLRPWQHPIMYTPLEVKQGQASIYTLSAGDGTEWILKRFSPANKPQRSYIDTVASCVPRLAECRCGWERHVLTRADLAPAGGMFYSDDLALWLDECLLMPRLPGDQWRSLLEDIAVGDVALDPAARIELGQQLARTIATLEQSGCSHRDLSGGNILVDRDRNTVHVVDWDTLYHPSLDFQSNTKIGSPGYIAPWVEHDAGCSWCAAADRFALAICLTELLAVRAGAALHGDGTLFEQAALGRDTAALRSAVAALNAVCPPAAGLLQQAWLATTFATCPTPDDWLRGLQQGMPTLIDRVGAQLEAALTSAVDADIVRWAQEWRRVGGGALPQTARARVLLARRRLTALQHLRRALASDDDALIAHRYHEALLDKCASMTPPERARVALALSRTS